MTENKISVHTEQLTRRFGQFVAVDRVSMRVRQGEIFGFLGANGAGKTTVIRMLCGLLKPSEGQATVAGHDVYRESEQIKQHIGYMGQRFSLYEDLTVNENVTFFGGIYGLPARRIEERKKTIFQQIGLTPYNRTRTRDLPLGFKQRLALGCALLHDPPILFLDEPTSGVDPQARREFWNLIYQMAEQGKTVFVTTHFMDEAEYCHRVLVMHEGKIIAQDSPVRMKEMYHRQSMQAVFIELIRSREKAE
jgi:ABC-2 type transport system ATP-binding protein